MLKLFRKDALTPQTERIYKVPLCIQDTIPIYRISENGIFELESPTNKDGGKKKIHQFDRMYLFEDINFSTQDEEEKEETGKRFETLLRSMNVSYKVIVSNHYADNGRLREEILQSAKKWSLWRKNTTNSLKSGYRKGGENFYNPSILLSVAESRIMKVLRITLTP